MTDAVTGFPAGVRRPESQEDKNPAVRLFGRRFFSDQPSMELLAEFLLVTAADKKIGTEQFAVPLPSQEQLMGWPEEATLMYAPKAKLNLKLFAFLGASRLDTRHESHRNHCRELWDALREQMDSGMEAHEKEDVLRTLSNLFLGFWGSGSKRTWCAQSFLPICSGLLAGEILWNETEARRDNNLDSWQYVLAHFQKLFSINRHRFFARGGEMLYLQICNALRQPSATIASWLDDTGLHFSNEEADPVQLHAALGQALDGFFGKTPAMITRLADFIDHEVECETAGVSDSRDGDIRWTDCGWCPEASWQEGYLFAVEILRICRAEIDMMDTIAMLEIACALQLLRSLIWQSQRYTTGNGNCRMLVSDPEGSNPQLKHLSQESLRTVEHMIWKAVRDDRISDELSSVDEKAYQEADDRYGRKLFRRVAKSLGIIVPRLGAGMRFVLNDQVLHYFVLTLITPDSGGRMTYDSFKKQIALHHGFVFDPAELRDARYWQDKGIYYHSGNEIDRHLRQMLEASGVLVHLSDSCALVKNPNCAGGQL